MDQSRVNNLINQLTAMTDLLLKIPQESQLSKEVSLVCIDLAKQLQRHIGENIDNCVAGDDIFVSDIGSLLHNKRGKRGLREISRLFGISASTLSRIESGELPNVETFINICNWIGITKLPCNKNISKPAIDNV